MESRQLDHSNEDDLRFEYDQLRKEILQNDQMTLQIMAFVLTAVGAILAIAFSDQQMLPPTKAILLLLAAFIALVGMNLETERVYVMYIIGSYIKTFIEPQSKSLRWETRLTLFRDKTLRQGHMNYGISQKWVYYIVIVVSIFMALCYFYLAYSGNFYIFLGIVVNVLLLYSYLLWRDFKKGKMIDWSHTHNFDQIWRDVAKLEKYNNDFQKDLQHK